VNYRTYSRHHAVLLTVAALMLLAGGGALTYVAARPPTSQLTISLGTAALTTNTANSPSGYRVQRFASPNRTQILDRSGRPLAIMTDGARTAHLFGPMRTFEESRFTVAKIKTDMWVRLAPRAWRAGAEKEAWFTNWLNRARADRSPDVLAIAMEYTYGHQPKKNKEGLQIAGDASFGPLSEIDPDGRAENSDFYDYLGIAWEFPDKTEKPAADHFLSLDCSGYLRMIYGYRLGYPLRGTNKPGPGLPRRAIAMAGLGPGVQLMPNTGERARELDRLLPGDLLFFNAGPIGGKHIEHSGMYMGVDDRGHHRFVSSRSLVNGPTMGDLGGESILDGTGYWAHRLRTARRL
jgi:NlpC/P60 family